MYSKCTRPGWAVQLLGPLTAWLIQCINHWVLIWREYCLQAWPDDSTTWGWTSWWVLILCLTRFNVVTHSILVDSAMLCRPGVRLMLIAHWFSLCYTAFCAQLYCRAFHVAAGGKGLNAIASTVHIREAGTGSRAECYDADVQAFPAACSKNHCQALFKRRGDRFWCMFKSPFHLGWLLAMECTDSSSDDDECKLNAEYAMTTEQPWILLR